MKTKWKIIIAVLVAVGVTGFGIYSFFRPLAADTETLEKRSLTISFTEEGKVVPLEEYEVYSLTGGEITQLHVKEGDGVQAGDFWPSWTSAIWTISCGRYRRSWSVCRESRPVSIRSLMKPALAARSFKFKWQNSS